MQRKDLVTTGSWQQLFRKPSCFNTTRPFCKTTQTRCLPWNLSTLHSLCGIEQKIRIFPTVHALEITKTEELSKQASGEFKRPSMVVSDDLVQEYLARETGSQRIQDLWGKDYKEEYSPQAEMTFVMTVQASFVGFLIASYFGTREAKENFELKNQATKFSTRFRALRAFNDAGIMAGMKTGALWGVKLGAFVGIILVTSQSIAAYRNKSSVLEYTTAGALTGGLFKFTMGPRGMLVASLLGGVLGTVGGAVIYGSMRITNETQEQRHYYDIRNKIQQDMYNKGKLPEVPEQTTRSTTPVV